MASTHLLAVGLAFVGGFIASGLYKSKNANKNPSEITHLLEEAIAKGLAEIQISRFALENTNSTNIKIFAQRMVDDYTTINQQLAEIANARNVAIPEIEKYDNIAAISAKKDTQLDDYYVEQQTQHHTEMKALFQSLEKLHDPLIRNLIAARSEQIAGHLVMANELATRFHTNTIPTSSPTDTGKNSSQIIEEPDYKI